MSLVRALSFVLALVASLIAAGTVRAEAPKAKAPMDLSMLLLPSAPGTSELALVSPIDGVEGREGRRVARPFGLGMGACALWATRAEWPPAGRQPRST